MIRTTADLEQPQSERKTGTAKSTPVPNPRNPAQKRPGDLPTPGHSQARNARKSGGKTVRRFFLSAFLAIGAGIVVAAAGQFRYIATGKFSAPELSDHCRREFLDFLWQSEQQGAVSSGWSVEVSPEDQTIAVSILEKTPEIAKSSILELADGLKEFLESREQSAAAEDAHSSQILENLISELSREAKQHSATLSADNSDSDNPLQKQERLRAAIADRVLELDQLRKNEKSAVAQLNGLRTRTIDQQTLVTQADLDAAYAKRPDLLQDIEQLDVQLRQARKFLDNVWQTTSPHMDQLLSTAATCVQTTVYLSDDQSDRPAGSFAKSATLYQQRLSRFAQRWNAAYSRLRDTPIDTNEPALFDAHNKIQNLLGDFLFHSDKLLDKMHDNTRRLTESAASGGDDQRVISDIRRGFHRLESAHRQLEFTASDIRRRNNFRLDSVMKSARGLLRRIGDEKDTIATDLEKRAREQWTEHSQSEKSALVTHIGELRERINGSLDEMIGLQELLAKTLPKIEEHLREGFKAETAKSRIAEINSQLIAREKTLDELQKRSDARRQLFRSELIKTEVDDVPANIRERMLFGLGAAIATFATCLALTSRLRFTS